MPITDPWFYLAAAPAILVVSISKGGFGGGLALLGVPMMSLVIPPAQAAAIMLPILLVMDAFSVWAYRRRYDRGVLAAMLPGAALGVALGGLAFGLLDARLMRLIVGLLALVFVAQYASAARASVPPGREGRGSAACVVRSPPLPVRSPMPAGRPPPSTSCRCAWTRRRSSPRWSCSLPRST